MSAEQQAVVSAEQQAVVSAEQPAVVSADQPAVTWTVVVPVKVTSQAKTRLAGDLSPTQRVELVRAMVVDTVAAARATPTVDRVVVVTDDPDVVADLSADEPAGTDAERRADPSAENRASTSAQHPCLRAHLDVVPEPSPAAGLNAAIRAGVASARSGGGLAAVSVAVLLGDLPALRPGDLGAALEAASAHHRAVVTDADGSGTTLLTARSGVELYPAFGPGSAAEHAARGHVVLDVADVPAVSGLRQDVDLARDLAAVAALGPGPRTTEVLDRWARLGEGSSAA
ncbi:uncharacterized conserved protein [Sanguibacter keddieii DSM 10542]|uniref:Phosphoenolpyruvate guanylyltransferase n=1 Tax=Sanguibacter keddieii (strain ATCC 51767 / DSM 10542 / NCFB 3025 / ST-74) TaxID=446469 RepID=FBID_SANKS|nr:2-phospho-L-lactate guanylyltransferase [Sanguibacter keddieii]D1BJD0.1 RecName: Full=Phosphoenolpyruvate guanylyltransferase; Short=PEP guanylyltransferase [Sanguibacter keddieii DSM 10542]ACZ22324.1 uncharacterized conserved protein [Sanguibacter keddieii DSM 10542]